MAARSFFKDSSLPDGGATSPNATEPFGQPFLANPDLVERLRRGAALNKPNPATYYGGGAEGYIDYPALGPSPAAMT